MGAQTQTTMFPIQFLIPYWEYRGPALSKLLEVAKHSGIKELFIAPPWSLLESDITHSLPKFLEMTLSQGFSVRIYASLPPGSSMLYGGFPKDLVRQESKLARDASGRLFSRWAPPEPYFIPSLYDLETQKRLLLALAKLDGIARGALQVQKGAREVVFAASMSFWDTLVGVDWSRSDRSEAARADYEKLQFSDPLKADLPTQHALAKSAFEKKIQDLFQKKNFLFESMPWESPETHPEAFGKLISALESSVAGTEDVLESASLYGRGNRNAWCWFLEDGALTQLPSLTRQSLLLRTLLRYGGASSGMVVPVREWLSCSEKFRSTLMGLAHRLEDKSLTPVTDVVLAEVTEVPHASSPLYEWFEKKLGSRVRRGRPFLGQSLDETVVSTRLIWFAPERYVEKDEALFIPQFVERGGTVILPKTIRADNSVATKLSRLGRGGQELQVNLPVPFSVSLIGQGKLIRLASIPQGEDLNVLCEKILRIADLLPLGELRSYPEVESLWFYRDLEKNPADPLHQTTVFLLNKSDQPKHAEVDFSSVVSFYDDTRLAQNAEESLAKEEFCLGKTEKFEMEIPANGVISLAIDGLGHDAREAQLAKQHAGVLKQNLDKTTQAGLADPMGGMDGASVL